MWIIAAAVLGAFTGAGLALQLRHLRYRRPDEQHLPHPRPAWWLIPATGLAWAWLTWQFPPTSWPQLALWLPLTSALGWLSVVDLDVQRLPDRVMAPVALGVAFVLGGDAIVRGSALQAATSLLIGVAVGLAAWLLHYISRGKFGFGDVKLVAILSTALAFIHPRLVLIGLLAACLIAIAGSLLTRRHEFAFGPSLAAGSVITAGLSAFPI